MYGMSCETLHVDSIYDFTFHSFVLIDEKNYTYHTHYTYYTLLYIINKNKYTIHIE